MENVKLQLHARTLSSMTLIQLHVQSVMVLEALQPLVEIFLQYVAWGLVNLIFGLLQIQQLFI